MSDEKQYTILEELKAKGIRQQDFDNFYHHVYQHRQLPPKGSTSRRQYILIQRYLKSKTVLDRRGNIQPDGLSLFEGKKKNENAIKDMESLLKETEKMRLELPVETSGGLASCREESISQGGLVGCRSYRESLSRGSGGAAPCRNDQDD